jgi:serralysin
MSTAFQVVLDGSQETPPNDSTATGEGTVVFDSAAVAASYSFDIAGLNFGPVTSGQTPTDLNDVTGMHFHPQVRGVAGPVVFGDINPAQDNDDLAIVHNDDGSWSVSGRWDTADPVSITDFSPVLGDTFSSAFDSATVGSDIPIYFNVHTVEHPAGVIRGQLVAIADNIDNVVTGTAGNDLLVGGSGNNAILGLTGDDTLIGGDGNNVLDGSGGNDLLIAGNGDNMLFGGAGNDTLIGGNGNDTLNGGTGDDVLVGGRGADQFVFNAGFGNDVIANFKNGDHIQFGDNLFESPEAVLMASQQVGEDTAITAGNNTVTLHGVQLSSLHADDFQVV